MKKFRSNILMPYSKKTIHKILDILAVCFVIISLLVSHMFGNQRWFFVGYIPLVIVWIVQCGRFYKETKMGFIKCCSLQLIIIGLFGSCLMALVNEFFVMNLFTKDMALFVLVLIGAVITWLRHKDIYTCAFLTFLLYMYCLLSVNLFLVVGFLSASLLLMAAFNGTLIFENQRMEDSEYFGNSGRSDQF